MSTTDRIDHLEALSDAVSTAVGRILGDRVGYVLILTECDQAQPAATYRSDLDYPDALELLGEVSDEIRAHQARQAQ